MPPSFGALNASLTKAINRVAQDTSRVKFIHHARKAMDDDDFDDLVVLACLRQGKVFGPEIQGRELRANVLHSGHHIRVVVGSIQQAENDWSKLASLTVVTVMRVD